MRGRFDGVDDALEAATELVMRGREVSFQDLDDGFWVCVREGA